ncbi:hypothetical protein G7Z17_g6378 [Cylindrodendrum hubeiense]|uniref:Uncharacterized protein n=1 Tax=Cylindrodendrum hubeiense TaxID=595255 RepID=A0A9P5LGD6_9HYPO|nr:hypothetical protein G7Z17_g6378 [Cylindrodendrum hubeiense]
MAPGLALTFWPPAPAPVQRGRRSLLWEAECWIATATTQRPLGPVSGAAQVLCARYHGVCVLLDGQRSCDQAKGDEREGVRSMRVYSLLCKTDLSRRAELRRQHKSKTLGLPWAMGNGALGSI